MRSKALIIGALADEWFAGPWVDISEAKEWDITVEEDYGRQVVVSVDDQPPVLLDGEPVRISGKRARAIVQAPVPNVKSVTVRLRQVE